ncbi:hypothetical protein mRhiFer1_008310 [Rhinolophus ferrumequinum]|uniref:Uncharacterized protein n=1 Tax=Rhinolophus ferrumequinum TaxID=59479 RepID=A0A7J7VR51_RHIFE|nr:hypothetical protein mRhiFer1_008310 [Rhinolophus ferrumequinum]
MWSFFHTPLVRCSCKPQALGSRGWAWAAFSRHLGPGSGSCREKPGGQGAGEQSPAQGRRTDRAYSALCWQRCVPASAVGLQPVGERILVPGPIPCLPQSALGNPLPSQALQTHPGPQTPGVVFHPHPAVSLYTLRLNGGLCGQTSYRGFSDPAVAADWVQGHSSGAACWLGLSAGGRAGCPDPVQVVGLSQNLGRSRVPLALPQPKPPGPTSRGPRVALRATHT